MAWWSRWSKRGLSDDGANTAPKVEISSGIASVFSLREDGDDCFVLINHLTGKEHPFKFHQYSAYEKHGMVKYEPDWWGTAQELFEKLIPILSTIHSCIKPSDDTFELQPAAYELDREFLYVMPYYLSTYRCTGEGGLTYEFTFDNWKLNSQKIPIGAPNAVKKCLRKTGLLPTSSPPPAEMPRRQI